MVDATGLLDINLFSLDVEGGELSVLRTLDLEATNIQVVVELDGRNPEKDEQVRCCRIQCPKIEIMWRDRFGPSYTSFPH